MLITPAAAVHPIPGGAWVLDHTVELLGSSFRLRCDDEVVAGRLRALVGDQRAGDDATATVFTLRSITADGQRAPTLLRDGEIRRCAPTWDPLLRLLFSDLNAEALGRCSHLAIHAGAVATTRGVVAFPAPSGAGKSTLTAACVLAGFSYVSDEALCASYGEGEIVPYPRPLGLSRWSCATLGLAIPPGRDDELLVAPASLGSVSPEPRLALADVVVPHRRAGAPALVELAASDAMAAMLAMAFNHYRSPAAAVALAADLAARAGSWRLDYDEPVAAATLLGDRLG